MSKNTYYNPRKIDAKNATYNIIFGQRSNGKTYALLKKGIQNWISTGKQMAYVRRWKEDVTGRRASQLFEGIKDTGEIAKITKGEYTGIYYYSGKYYMCNYDENGKALYNDLDIICYVFSITDSEHDKSTSYPNISLIVFDEFITNKQYLPDEFVYFMNVVSTIVRKREDVKIYMLGNTVNKYCPYFSEMGLNNIKQQQQGTIDVYRYGNSSLTVAVEYCSSIEVNKKSNKYFAFDNPKLEMITGGAWELSIYPHLPVKYKPKNVLLTYFIEFNDNIFQCEIIQVDSIIFTFIHAKTTPIKNPEKYIIYSLDYNPELNYNRSIFKPLNKVQDRILWFFKTDRVYYQDNNIGDSINNFLKICKRG